MVSEQCAVCSSAAHQRCGGCHMTYYCSRDHQKQDWKSHRDKCRPFKVEQNADLGRFLVASRDISAGELVIREQPLVSGPPQLTPPLCLGCYAPLSRHTSVECPRCGWPMCSTRCADSPDHKAECHITTDVRGAKVSISNFEQVHPTYQCVSALRVLYLRGASPARWAKLWALEAHCEQRRHTPKFAADRVAVAQFVRRFFKLDSFSEEDILRVCGILQVNGHEVPLTEPPYVSVYEQASMLEHSCRANCAKSFAESGELLVRAAVPIARGEHLSICYSDSLWGTPNRRHHLRETKFFWCLCPRCTDPTELDTFFSALRCPSPQCSGVCVPLEASLQRELSDDEDEPPWWCRLCGHELPAAEVLQLLESAGSELSRLPRGDAAQCLCFLRRQECAGRLSADHFYLTEVRLALAQLLGQLPGGLAALDDQGLALKAQLCRRMLALIQRLCPAENRVRGLLLCELQASVAEEARRLAARGVMEANAFRDNLLESRKLLLEALDVLRYEPEVLPEGKMAVLARERLRDVDMVLENLRSTVLDSLF